MLDAENVDYRYREYKKEVLSEDEIRQVLAELGLGARDVLRKQDRALKEAGLDGSESEDRLIELMAAHPTALQRPIGRLGGRAVVGRPPERLLELVRG